MRTCSLYCEKFLVQVTLDLESGLCQPQEAEEVPEWSGWAWVRSLTLLLAGLLSVMYSQAVEFNWFICCLFQGLCVANHTQNTVKWCSQKYLQGKTAGTSYIKMEEGCILERHRSQTEKQM